MREANESLSTKSNAVAALEAKISQLEASLSDALADVKTKTSAMEQLQNGKRTSDAEVHDLKARLQQIQAEHSRELAALDLAREEVRFLFFNFVPI